MGICLTITKRTYLLISATQFVMALKSHCKVCSGNNMFPHIEKYVTNYYDFNGMVNFAIIYLSALDP